MAETETVQNVSQTCGRKTCQELFEATFESGYTTKFYRKIPEKYVLLRRFKWLKRSKVVEGLLKGVKFVLPWYESRLVYVGEQNIDYEPFQVRTSDKFDVGLDLAIKFQVEDAYTACHKNKNIFQYVRNEIQDALNVLVMDLSYEDLVRLEVTNLSQKLATARETADRMVATGKIPANRKELYVKTFLEKKYGKGSYRFILVLTELYKKFKNEYGVKVVIASKQRIIQDERMKKAFAAETEAQKEQKANLVRIDTEVKRTKAVADARNEKYLALIGELMAKGFDPATARLSARDLYFSDNANNEVLTLIGDSADNAATTAGLVKHFTRPNNQNNN